MSLIMGSATDHADFSDKLLAAISGHSMTTPVINAAGTGYTVGDTLTVAGGTSTIAATIEVVTITGGGGTGPIGTMRMLNCGAYTATPSVTANAVTGGTGSGATVDLTYFDNGWVAQRSDSALGEREVIVKSLGGGSDGIYMGWRTYSNVPNDYYNLELAGMLGYTSDLPWSSQPGISHGRYDESTLALKDGCYLITTSVSFNYFINVTPYRVIITVAIGSNYFHAYMGWGNRFGTASEFPYPMIISGCCDQMDNNTTLVEKISSIIDPWSSSGSSFNGPMQCYGADGVWYGVQNRRLTSGQGNNCVVPTQQPSGNALAAPQDKFMSVNGTFSNFIYSVSSGSGGATTANMLPTDPTDDRILLPCFIVFSVPEVGMMYEIDDCFWCSAFGGITSEDRFINAAGDAYRIFKNGNRSDNYAFIAIKE